MFFQIGQIPEIDLEAEEGVRSVRNLNLNLLDPVKTSKGQHYSSITTKLKNKGIMSLLQKKYVCFSYSIIPVQPAIKLCSLRKQQKFWDTQLLNSTASKRETRNVSCFPAPGSRGGPDQVD